MWAPIVGLSSLNQTTACSKIYTLRSNFFNKEVNEEILGIGKRLNKLSGL